MDASTAVYAADGSINQDITCKKCGYNLRGLRENGLCPECATPVGRSVTGDLLRFADPAWVGRVAFGLNLIVLGIVITILLGCTGGVLAAMSGSALLSQIAGYVGIVINAVGIWCMTSPDPSGIGEDARVNARRIVRTTMLIHVAGSIAPSLWLHPLSGQFVTALLALLGFANGIVHLVCEWFKFFFYQSLALRVPEPTLARRARFLRYAYAAALGLGIIGGIMLFADAAAFAPPGVAMLAPPATLPAPGTAPPALSYGVSRRTVLSFPGGGTTPFSPGGGPLTYIGGILLAVAGLAAVIFGLLTLLLVLRLRRVMSIQAQLARQTWARAVSTQAPTT
ncbi:MAG: hypothetical protein CHACPFDD_00100 [Phycisphaerae bacterium]|nr:hypothetical protein [Phycisphaerae bacterium]